MEAIPKVIDRVTLEDNDKDRADEPASYDQSSTIDNPSISPFSVNSEVEGQSK